MTSTSISIDQKDLTINWSDFLKWLNSKYSKTYVKVLWYYNRKYHSLITNDKVRELDLLSESIKNNVVKSLIVLSKYLGCHEAFKTNLKAYGIKLTKTDAIKSFLRILKASDSDILNWYNQAINNVRPHEQTFLKFLLLSGIRKQEAINSFNLIIKLRRQNRLDEYYDKDLKCLQHFKYDKTFIRNTKNVFISFIPEELIYEIANSKEITYPMIYKRLKRKHMKCRINELRDYYGTYLLNHGLLEQEVNLLQGRIPKSIFIKHYWSPNLKQLRDKVFKALKQLEHRLQ